MSSRESPSPFVPVVLAWLIPGAGHLKIGRPWPALFVLGGVIPLFVLGMWLAGFENVSHVRHKFYFILHVFAGGPALLADVLTTDVKVTEALPYRAVGVLFSAVAGLLNLIAISDVWARCVRGDPEEMADRLEKRTNPLDPAGVEELIAETASDPDGGAGDVPRDPSETPGV